MQSSGVGMAEAIEVGGSGQRRRRIAMYHLELSGRTGRAPPKSHQGWPAVGCAAPGTGRTNEIS